jgi:hypothetical protein
VSDIESEGDSDPSVLEGRCIDGQDVCATARKRSFEDDDRWIFSVPGHDQDHWPLLSSTTEESAARRRRAAGGALPLHDLVVVVAPGRRAAVTIPCEASDDIEAFDLAVLEVAKAEHRARLRLSQLVHDLPFWSGLVEPVDKKA